MADELDTSIQTPSPEDRQVSQGVETSSAPEAKIEITSPVTPPVAAPVDPVLLAQVEEWKQKAGKSETEAATLRAEAEQLKIWKQERDWEPRVTAEIKRLIDEGWDESHARQHVEVMKRAYLADERAKQADANARTQYQGQVLEAIELVKKFGGSVEELLSLSPVEMRAKARDRGEIATLKKQMAELTKRSVPSQDYESGQGGGGKVPDDVFVQEVADGKRNSAADSKRAREILAQMGIQ